jgi:hypothetical protein
LFSILKLRKVLSDIALTVYTIEYYITKKKPTTIVKRKLISKIGNYYGCKIMVESGTYFGQSTKYFSKIFNKVFSVELSPALYDFSSRRFSKISNIFLYLGDSVVQLPRIILLLNQPTIFYLDAHASGGVTQQGQEPSPIKKELEIISNFKHLSNSIILLDDARGFDGSNSYPSFMEVSEWAARNELSKPYIKLDMIIIEPVSKIYN